MFAHARQLIGYVLLVCLAILLIFHLLIISTLLPSNMVWGGQELSITQVRILETIAVAITLFFISITLTSIDLIKNDQLKKVAQPTLIFMGSYFSLNIFTNLLSNNSLEKIIFVPLSLVMAICAFLLAKHKPKAND